MVSGILAKDIADVLPEEAWAGLSEGRDAMLVDCRTAFEWDSIGVPDLSSLGQKTHLVEWRQAPGMTINSEFETQLELAIGDSTPKRIYFLCRSGVRSREAATVFQAKLASKEVACTCINVATGFEGDPDSSGMRGQINGWQARGLPWTQGQ